MSDQLSRSSESDDEFVYTTEAVSPDDPIAHGRRWREERNRARTALSDIYSELSHGRTANWEYIDKRYMEGMRDGIV